MSHSAVQRFPAGDGLAVQCRQDVSAIVSRLDLCLRGKFFGIRTRNEQKKWLAKLEMTFLLFERNRKVGSKVYWYVDSQKKYLLYAQVLSRNFFY